MENCVASELISKKVWEFGLDSGMEMCIRFATKGGSVRRIEGVMSGKIASKKCWTSCRE